MKFVVECWSRAPAQAYGHLQVTPERLVFQIPFDERGTMWVAGASAPAMSRLIIRRVDEGDVSAMKSTGEWDHLLEDQDKKGGSS
jgi:hypothetical protein